CSGTSLVGASPERTRPSDERRDSRAGSRKPSEALVGVTSQPPSSSFTLILPEEPGVSPRSKSERPKRQIASLSLASLVPVSLMALFHFLSSLTLWRRGQAVVPKNARSNSKLPRKRPWQHLQSRKLP